MATSTTPATPAGPTAVPARQRAAKALEPLTRWGWTVMTITLALLFVGGLWGGVFFWCNGRGGFDTQSGEISISFVEGNYRGTDPAIAINGVHLGLISSSGPGTLWETAPYSWRLQQFRVLPTWHSSPRRGTWIGLPMWMPLVLASWLTIRSWRRYTRGR